MLTTLPRRVASVLALTASALLLGATASAVPVTVNFACQGTTPLGPQTFPLTQGADVTAPASVASGANLTVTVDPQPATLPGTVNGFTLRRVQNLSLKVPVPANSTFVSATLSGGAGVGTTGVSQSGGVITLTATGPVAGGAVFELPTVSITLRAGAAGSTIQTSMYGSSYSNPGLTATGVVSFIVDINVPTSCYPNPNPVITSTSVV